MGHVECPVGAFGPPVPAQQDPSARRGGPADEGVVYRAAGDPEPAHLADSFPSEALLAAMIGRTVAHGVPFKLTAGLHNAVRHRDPVTGFEHHGFLNVIAATASAL